MFLFQWMKEISEIRKIYPDVDEDSAVAPSADGSSVTDPGIADDGSCVQLSGVPADDIESPWYYENIGFFDRSRVTEFALSGCCWIDASSIAVSDYNGSVRVLSSSSSSASHTFEHVVATWQHSSSARAVIPLSSSNLLSVGSDCNVRLFDLSESRVISSAAMPQRLSSAFHEKTLGQVAVGCSGGALLVLDPETLQLIQTLPGHAAEVTCVASHAAFGSPLLLTSSLDATVRLWDVRSGKKSSHVLRMHRSSSAPLYSVVACDSCIVAGDEDGELTAWQGSEFVPVKSLYNNNGPPTPCYLASDSTGTLFSSAAAVNNQKGMLGCVLVRQGLAQTPTYGVGDGQLGEISCLSLRDDGCACQSQQVYKLCVPLVKSLFSILFDKMTLFARLALLAGTLDGCVQLLSVRDDESARTHKSQEWYWLDASVNAEYCSTYRDALTAEQEQFREKLSSQSAVSAAVPKATSTPEQLRVESSDAGSTVSRATVRFRYSHFFTRTISLITKTVGVAVNILGSLRFGSASESNHHHLWLCQRHHTHTVCATFGRRATSLPRRSCRLAINSAYRCQVGVCKNAKTCASCVAAGFTVTGTDAAPH